MPTTAEGRRVSVGLFAATLVRILSRKAKLASSRVRRLHVPGFAATLAVSGSIAGSFDNVWHRAEPRTNSAERVCTKQPRDRRFCDQLTWKCLASKVADVIDVYVQSGGRVGASHTS